MEKPEMILFDWGHTLMYCDFDGVRGMEAVLAHAKNTNGHTALEIQKFADRLSDELGRSQNYGAPPLTAEIHQFPFQRYLYEYFGIEFDLTPEQLDMVFFENADSIKPSDGIADFLDFLERENIRTGVISNISHTGRNLEKIINDGLPNNNFEFIIASSEYVFRKPHTRIFEIACRKAGLEPDKIWYCGDNVTVDIEGANGAGMFPVWYKGCCGDDKRQKQAECSQLVVYSWDELKNYILQSGGK